MRAFSSLYTLISRNESTGEPGKIVVTQGQVEHLAASFAKAWQRPPSDEELAGLVRDWVREEVYVREALALGLDQDDEIIRRRLRQKLEFISEDVSAEPDPTDADLDAYLQAHLDWFRDEHRITFRQVYLNPAKHGTSLARDATQLLAQLSHRGAKADVSGLGDPFLLEHQFVAVPPSEVAKQFGQAFAAKLSTLLPGEWQGAGGVRLRSPSGVRRRTHGGRQPVLAEVRDAVRREWDNSRRLEANESFYQGLLKRYTVTPRAAGTAGGADEAGKGAMKRGLLILALLAGFAPGLFAHEVRPAYLQLRQTGPETFDVLWKVPGRGQNLRLGLYVELPAGCTNLTAPRTWMATTLTERWTVNAYGWTHRRHDSHRRPPAQ